jgi:8-oxo-dGTP diphosphatase
MRRYVVGFLFDVEHQQVALVKKLRPEWQKGRWNGVGGRIEGQETALEAMRREFQEEAGLLVVPWHFFCELRDRGLPSQDPGAFRLNCFTATHPDFATIQTKTDEEIRAWDVAEVRAARPGTFIANVPWLVSMALSVLWRDDGCRQFVVTEAELRT